MCSLKLLDSHGLGPTWMKREMTLQDRSIVLSSCTFGDKRLNNYGSLYLYFYKLFGLEQHLRNWFKNLYQKYPKSKQSRALCMKIRLWEDFPLIFGRRREFFFCNYSTFALKFVFILLYWMPDGKDLWRRKYLWIMMQPFNCQLS